ncbi:MAG: hypothetical protein ACREJN_01090 [Nitrospiraceae bacterium]
MTRQIEITRLPCVIFVQCVVADEIRAGFTRIGLDMIEHVVSITWVKWLAVLPNSLTLDRTSDASEASFTSEVGSLPVADPSLFSSDNQDS